jgi:hypothetical protein
MLRHDHPAATTSETVESTIIRVLRHSACHRETQKQDNDVTNLAVCENFTRGLDCFRESTISPRLVARL